MGNIYNKVKNLDELSLITKQLKKRGKRIVQCHGVFDLVHPGHIRHLSTAKKEGDILIVTITADRFVKRGPGRPIFNENLRAETLAALEMVDYVAIDHHPTAVDAIKKIEPNIYVKGQEYAQKDKDVTGKIYDEEMAVRSVGGKLVFTDGATFSSSKLINDHLDVFSQETRHYLKDIAEKYPIDQIINSIKAIKKMKILVIGDAIIDQYHYCEGMDKSRKSNVVVQKYISEESFAGGALAVANHLSGLSDHVSLVTVTGADGKYNDFIAGAVNPLVKVINYSRKDAPTIVKRRYVSFSQKLFEICYLNDQPLPAELEKQIALKLKKIIKGYDLVVVSDFGHGFIAGELIDIICKNAKYLAVNTQTNGANMGFNLITQYFNVNYVALDELEIRYAAHDKTGGLNKIIKDISKKVGCDDLVVTRGFDGALSFNKKQGFVKAPALATKVVDAVGAGDAFLAFTAPCVALNMPQDLVAFIGNAVGALAVQIVCNRRPVDAADLFKFITRLLK